MNVSRNGVLLSKHEGIYLFILCLKYYLKIFQTQEIPRKIDVAHGKSLSAVESDSAYKTVDFLKTEAFNITRQDAEASRSNQF